MPPRIASVDTKTESKSASPSSAQGIPPASPEALAVVPTSFDALLRHTIGLSMGQRNQKGASEALASVLRELQPEARVKLQIVMTAGRDGLSIGAAHAAVPAVPGDAVGASELESAGEELGDYLARGYAIACATQFELDVPLSRWSTSESGELEERIWLRFGKQLASFPLEKWECLGAVSGSGEGLAQLYLRLGKAVWWSFGAVLDRPSPETVRKHGRGRARHSKLGTLGTVAGRRCDPQRRALRRALRAIRARVNKPLDG